MGSSQSKGPINVPALGRPFRLGMLYDCLNEKLIHGITLWDNDYLQHHLVSQPQVSANFKIHTEESIADKANALDINASLKLSILGGLVEVSGSAKYLNDRKSSNNTVRVSMHYKCTTKFEEITMEHMDKGKIMHHDVFEYGIATHVVIGIKYGGQAFFVFEKQFSERETQKNVHGDLHDAIKALPGIASLDSTENLKDKVDGFEFIFYGDCIPPTNPTTYLDAVKLYKDLPKLMGKAKNSVPMHVWLYPLEKLDSKAAKLVREISFTLVDRTEKTLEQLQSLEIRCKDLAGSEPCQKFHVIRKTINNFQEMIEEYKFTFQKQIMQVLPNIRRGGSYEVVLEDIIEKRKTSPFDHRHLSNWMEEAEALVRVAGTYVSSMSEIHFAHSPGVFSATIFNPSNRYIVCFTMRFVKKSKLLTAMQSYLRRIKDADYNCDGENVSKDYLYDALADTIVQNARQFKEFAAANTGSSGTCFIVHEDKKELENPGGFIFLYKDGKLMDRNFKPPSKPGRPTFVDSTHDSIQLKWKVPDQGVSIITYYVVSYKQSNDSETDWTTVSTSNKKCSFTANDLKIASVYLFQVKAVCEAGVSRASVESEPMTTGPTCPPSKPEVKLAAGLVIGVKWNSPDIIAENVDIKVYDVQYCMMDTTAETGHIEVDKMIWCDMMPVLHNTPEAEHKAINNKIYMYRVRADCGDAGQSKYSPTSEAICLNISQEIKNENILLNSRLVYTGSPSVYALNLEEVVKIESEKIHKYEFGNRNRNKPTIDKVIMLVGATGAGKSTFINGLINYVFGVKWEDRYRFKLVHEDFKTTQATSQTTSITSYTIHHQNGFQVPYTLTIIDTPGIGDTSGISRDKEITKQIRSFYSTKGICGIDHIDAIGFVAQAALARLTPTQKYIFDSILSLLGKDIADNIFILVTFADGQKPPVMVGIKEAQLPYKGYYKFNNSALFAQNRADGEVPEDEEKDEEEEEGGGFDNMFWQMGTKSFKQFCTKLAAIEPKSLLLTKDVLDEHKTMSDKDTREDMVDQVNEMYDNMARDIDLPEIPGGMPKDMMLEYFRMKFEAEAENKNSHLETYIVGIQSGIQTGLNKLEQLKKEDELLRQYQKDIDMNKEFKYRVEEEKAVYEEIPTGTYITNCMTCNRTCHYPCGIPDDDSKSLCSAMSDNNCQVCANQCHWSMHKNMTYQIVIERHTVEKNSEDLKKRYEDAKGAKMSAQQIMNNISEEFEDVQFKVLELTEDIRKSLNRLQEIALLPNPLSSVEYIDILIQNTKDEAKPGWLETVKQLNNLRENAKLLKNVKKKNYDPFQQYISIEHTLPRREKQGRMGRLKSWLGV
ncbi:uncharacterized protein [Antedon mediterranea]|uniref:uncharacterized protein n=1 Tax=Antedon mediterranea TaxID=105859 RepID=UPI003AF73D62